MPFVSVTLIEGYDEDAKRRLCHALTGAVQRVVPADLDAITSALNEVSPSGYMRGGAVRTPAPGLPDGEATVRQFLSHMEARDLDAASAMLGDDFSMTFPGNVAMTRLAELVDWASSRYRAVRKTYERFDTACSNRGLITYCYGTLSGEWLDGDRFDGIRFIDRFEIDGGKLIRQDVWNDMGEMRRV
ncbi:MAG: tautomerase family protein [Pseudomonadota bacterium]